ncbi:SPOR domain-containing protein [Allopontixanthobacter sp.]|uniref:SPOR domain-containing protein n=1 Tax=Allopontixanthobacter sp. TaxID=2906452 RepID=UPI002ABAD514|nr:SPOR domain-containing protein [Allopontixanthobacter sp.]MDZ4307375.1 SPOR domain-containing protein [Allopontixanthobacter sp.]
MLKFVARGPICAAVTVLCLSGAAAYSVPLAAQSGDAAQSRAVVQPLPPAGVEALNTALSRLARNSRDLDALIDAGNASLQLNDIDAAIGFFGRADALSPGNAQVKVGLAGAFVRSERPIEALRLFDEAERAGASTAALAEERGLAFDLVGDPVSAQAQYVRAMVLRPNDELTRRMALSQAISGNRVAFEKTLLPLLERRDLAAYRTRAFALAILGEEDEAVSIAVAVMPPELSARMTPYLRYMRKLTKAQQAAAGNLGIFPRAAQIGRDDPRIAQYVGPTTSSAAPARTADAALTPQGAPLGPTRTDSASTRRRPDRGTSAVAAPIKAPVQMARVARNPITVGTQPAPTELPPTQPTPAAVDARPGFSQPQPDAAGAIPPGPQQSSERVAVVQQIPVAAQETVREPAAQSLSVADAFAGLTPQTVVPDTAGAVDITAIKPRREIAAKPEPKPEPKPAAKPEPPKHPSRIWVQIATGKDRKALAFDWRRISRKVPAVLGDKAKPLVKPYLADWGQTNRLLAGPYASEKAARAAVATLKADGIDSFTFTSSAGEEVTDLPR